MTTESNMMLNRKSKLMSGLGAIGITYSSAPYWAMSDGRPSISISLYWLKAYILLPYRHVTPFGHGSATSDYGFFWWPKLNPIPKFYFTTRKDRGGIL